jgi:DNA-binding NarL/FixJ family response regulator
MGIRVLVVEDQPKILKAQIKLLETFEEIEIVGSKPCRARRALEEVEEVPPRGPAPATWGCRR